MSQEKAAEVIDLNATRKAASDRRETTGEFLAAARNAAGLSIEDVSAAVKIKPEHLRAIEASDMEALPAAPYAIGFVKVYAGFLGLDAAILAGQFKGEIAPRAEAPGAAPAPETAKAPELGGGAQFASLAGIILILGFAVWIIFQVAGRTGREDPAADRAGAAPVVRLGDQAAPTPTPRPRGVLAVEEPEAAGQLQSLNVELAQGTESAAPGIEAPDAGEPPLREGSALNPGQTAEASGSSDAAAPGQTDTANGNDIIVAENDAADTRASQAPDIGASADADGAGETQPDEQSAPVSNEDILRAAAERLEAELAASSPSANAAVRSGREGAATPDDDAETPRTGRSTANSSGAIESGTVAPLDPPPAREPVITQASLARTATPIYPERCARRANENESVSLVFDISASGRPANIRVTSSTNSCFDQSAISTIARWRFDPKTVNGIARADQGKTATLNFAR